MVILYCSNVVLDNTILSNAFESDTLTWKTICRKYAHGEHYFEYEIHGLSNTFQGPLTQFTMTTRDIIARYPRRARSALGVDIVLTLDVCLYVSALERKRLIGMTWNSEP